MSHLKLHVITTYWTISFEKLMAFYCRFSSDPPLQPGEPIQNKVFACLMLSMFEQSLIRPAVVFGVFISLAASG